MQEVPSAHHVRGDEGWAVNRGLRDAIEGTLVPMRLVAFPLPSNLVACLADGLPACLVGWAAV